MGRFMLYGDDVAPSDSYLAAHELENYDPDTDYYHDDYDVEDDDEALHMTRTCENCGCSFTVFEAMSEYADEIDWPPYTQDFIGDLCGGCAIERTRENMN